MLSQLETVNLFDLNIITNSVSDFYQILSESLSKSGRNKTIVLMTPNPEQIVLAQRDTAFKGYLQKADWLIPDGKGIVEASKYFYKLKLRDKYCISRIAGADVVAKIMMEEAKVDNDILVIGGFYDEYVLQKNANDPKSPKYDQNMTQKVHNLENKTLNDENTEGEKNLVKKIKLANGQVLNWVLGYEKIKKPTLKEEENLRKIIKKLRPKIVFVAFGAPDQEKWLVEWMEFLSQNEVKLAMAIGGSFDFLTGKTTRAPQIMQNVGLEWLFRLIKQPWRWRRQLSLIAFLNIISENAKLELKQKSNSKK